jgi:hypothetical protein
VSSDEPTPFAKYTLDGFGAVTVLKLFDRGGDIHEGRVRRRERMVSIQPLGHWPCAITLDEFERRSIKL